MKVIQHIKDVYDWNRIARCRINQTRWNKQEVVDLNGELPHGRVRFEVYEEAYKCF